MTDIEERLARYRNEYHRLDNPTVPDEVFDIIAAECKTRGIEVPVGSTAQFSPTKHSVPMLSIKSIYTQSELLQVEKSFFGHGPYSCEPKMDGMSLSLSYIDGHLTSAITRGDGVVGELVTQNASKVPNIPKELSHTLTPPHLLVVRGEIIMPKSQVPDAVTTARNLAAGIMRRSKVTADLDRLKFYAYWIAECSDTLPDSQHECLALLHSWGFNTVSSDIAATTNEVMEIYNNYQHNRDSLDFEIDGVVIKVDSRTRASEIGVGTTVPKWALAFKFPPTIVPTKFLAISWSIGRTGVLTPVAIVEPVMISGVVVSKVNLYNIDELSRLGLRYNDTVSIKRCGDVIPKIGGVLWNNEGNCIQIPKRCPYCESATEVRGKGLYCTGNNKCIGVIVAVLEHYCKTAGIKGIGHRTLESIVRTTGISTVDGLLQLKEDSGIHPKILEKIASKKQ